MKITQAEPDSPKTRVQTLQKQRATIRAQQLQALKDEQERLVAEIDFARRRLNRAETRMREAREDQLKLEAEAKAEDDERILR